MPPSSIDTPRGRHKPVVYFMRRESDGAVKIGTTTNINKRRADIEREHGCRVVVLGFVPGSFKKERRLHGEFSAWRCEGEWFDAPLLAGLGHMLGAADVEKDPLPPKAASDDKTPNPRYPGRGKGSGSAPISKLGKRVPISVTVSPENKAWLDASGCKRSALVNLALDGLRAVHGDDWPRVRALLDAERA